MTKKTFMGIPLDRFVDADSYVSRRLRRGDKRNCAYPQNGIPKTKVKSGPAPSVATIFGIEPSARK